MVPVDYEADRRRLRLEAVERQYGGGGVHISLEVEYGSPRLNILHRLEERDVGLLVLNNRSRRGFARWLRRGVVASIVGRASCSVLVLR